MCSSKKKYLIQIVYAIFLLCAILFSPHQSFSQEFLGVPLDIESAFEKGQEWGISADIVTSLEDGLIIEASGNVIVSSGEDYLRADFARFFTSTSWVFLKGNVRVKLGADEVSASEAEFDLTNNTGWLVDANIFMAGPHIYFSGDRLIKHYGDQYLLQGARVTACDGDSPLWSVRAEEVNIKSDGYASLINPVFEVKDVGIMALPIATIPVKMSRQTGFLTPSLGQSSFHGFYYTQPFYWSIDQSRDMTFNVAILQDTGVMPSIEYRSHTSDTNKNWFSANALYDAKIVSFDKDDPIDNKDGFIRDNNFRYWVRGMTQGEIASSDWYYKANLDYVSDQNFLHEIKTLTMGFEDSRTDAYDFFGRDFAEIDQNRITEGFIYRDWSRLRIAGGLMYEQNPALENGNMSISLDTTLHELPKVELFLQQGPIVDGLPLDLRASASVAYMYRHFATSGVRAEFFPHVSIPIDISVASLLFSAGARTTFYNTTDSDQSVGSPFALDSPIEKMALRFVPETETILYTQASRVWDLNLDTPINEVGETKNVALQHNIQPRLVYSWSPFTVQENNPYFIPEDRLLSQKNITFSIDNFFTLRKETLLNSPDGPKVSTSYTDGLKLSLSSGFDFEEYERTRNISEYPRKPIHDLSISLSADPYPWLSLWTNSLISMYDFSFVGVDAGLTLKNNRWGSWNISYSRRTDMYNYREIVQFESFSPALFEENLNVISNEVFLRITPSFMIYANDRTNLDTGISYEQGIGISYQYQCFSFDLEYSREAREERYLFRIKLLGLSF